MLKFLHCSFYGKQLEQYEKVNDISVHEFVILSSVVMALILFGIYPTAILNLLGGV